MQPGTITQPSKPSASCVHVCKQRAVPASSKHNYESTQSIRGLYFCSQSMPSITSDVSYGSTWQGTPGIDYAVPAPTTTDISMQARESLTTVFSSANMTDSTGATAVVHPVLTTMSCLTKLCMAPLSTKHSTLSPLHYATCKVMSITSNLKYQHTAMVCTPKSSGGHLGIYMYTSVDCQCTAVG